MKMLGDPSTAYAADGLGGDFLWRYCADGKHIDAAVDALMEALSKEGRLWNPHLSSYTRVMFRRRLEAAQRGELRPVDEVKAVGNGAVKLFEIRWSNVNVAHRESSGGRPSHIMVEVRLYYVEPHQFGRIILGLHCHEKLTTGDDHTIKAAQDAEIEKAITCYEQGLSRRWGLEIG